MEVTYHSSFKAPISILPILRASEQNSGQLEYCHSTAVPLERMPISHGQGRRHKEFLELKLKLKLSED